MENQTMLASEFKKLKIDDIIRVNCKESPDHKICGVVKRIERDGTRYVNKGLPWRVPLNGFLVHVKLETGEFGCLSEGDAEYLEKIG